MRNYSLAAALLSLSLIPASATEGIHVAPGVRAGTSCSLIIDSETIYNGLCNVIAHGTTTVINTGSTNYYINRTFLGSYSGFFSDSSGYNYGKINADNGCWAGRRVTFCAE